MTAHNDLDRQLTDFLQEGPDELPYQSFDAVRDRTEQTGQRVVIGPWRLPEMNKIVTLGLGAAAVVVAILVGVQLIGPPDGGTGAQSTPSATAESTPQPTPEPTESSAADTGLPEGPHVILTGQDPEEAVTMPPLTVTIPAPGWEGDVGGGILLKDGVEPQDGAGMIIFTRHEYFVYGDACHWETTVPDTPVTSVDEFVAALSAQGSRNASEPVDIALDGYAGKSITLEVPDDVDLNDCDPGYGGSWDCGEGGMEPCGYHGGQDAIDVVYILDVDGVIVAWETGYHRETPAELVAELAAIVDSASFGD